MSIASEVKTGTIVKVGRNMVEAIVSEITETGVKVKSRSSGREFETRCIERIVAESETETPETEATTPVEPEVPKTEAAAPVEPEAPETEYRSVTKNIFGLALTRTSLIPLINM